jgi:hypothetical protein
MPLFDESTLRKLEQLTLVAEQVRVGVMKGDRRSRKRGTSIEFADYREYVKGDDLRRLDWNVYARLERPFIKLLEEEEDLSAHFLIDASASMNWPDDDPTDQPTNKLTYALRLAGALGHIALTSGDLVTAVLLNSQSDRLWGPFRGGQNSLRLLQFLESGAAGGITDLNLSLRNYALRGRRPGLLFLVSDLLSPNGWQDGLSALLSRPIILMYMLRLRRREMRVSSTLLWEKLVRDREANAPWQRLRRNLLLLLQLLILGALVLALARPFLPTPAIVRGNTVVLLDASASMQAADVAPSRFAAAQAEVGPAHQQPGRQ